MTEEALFHEALARSDPAERAAFLTEHCPDPDLRARVEALLAAHEQFAGVLERPAATGAYTPDPDVPGPSSVAGVSDPGYPASQRPATAEDPGSRIGPYKLLQLIGEGGMGSVWMAEQEQPVRRKVALKVIKPGMDSAQVIARFEAERQALALMDHPNIAKVFDGGTTPAGRPFFVMELVKGVPITKYCDEARLTPRERLELFVPVCQAVQHAHQKGIIHRDLKPSNVLIALYDGKPVPKVIDFGVAKALHQKLTERTIFTEFGQVVGTLEYMSPEQAELNQLDIDTRSDVYSLGVLLYELLTGTTPFDRKRLRLAAFAEILRIIREEEPPKPSTRLSGSAELPSVAAQRRTEPKRLSRLVSGDLDWVVMKCLEKDRTRRYETANGLAAELQRYLADEPVEAGPPSARYRLRKFARRYRRPLLAAAAFALLLVAGAAVSAWQAVRATREATRANQAEQQARDEATRATQAEKKARDEAAIAKAVNDFLRDDLLDQANPLGDVRAGVTPLNEVRLRTLLDRAGERIGGKFEKQPLVEAAVRLTIGNSYMNLKEYDAARPHIERAWEIRRRELGEENVETMDSLFLLGSLHLNTGKGAQAEPYYAKILEIRRRILGEDHPDTLTALHCLALSLAGRDDARAEPLLVRCLEGCRRVYGEEHTSTQRNAAFLALVYSRQGRYELAESLYVKNLEISRRVWGEDHLEPALHMWALGQHYKGRGKYAQAEQLYLKVLEIHRRVWGEDHRDTLNSLSNLGSLYLDWGKPAQAEAVLAQAWDKYRRTQGEEGGGTLSALYRLAQAEHDQGKYAQAEPKFAKVVDGRRRALGSEHVTVADVLAGQGNNLLQQQKYVDAEPPLRECLTIREKKQPDDWSRFNTQSLLGGCLSGQKKYAEAEPLLVSGYEGMKVREARIPAGSRKYLPEAVERLVQLYEAWGQPEKANEWRAKLPPP